MNIPMCTLQRVILRPCMDSLYNHNHNIVRTRLKERMKEGRKGTDPSNWIEALHETGAVNADAHADGGAGAVGRLLGCQIWNVVGEVEVVFDAMAGLIAGVALEVAVELPVPLVLVEDPGREVAVDLVEKETERELEVDLEEDTLELAILLLVTETEEEVEETSAAAAARSAMRCAASL